MATKKEKEIVKHTNEDIYNLLVGYISKHEHHFELIEKLNESIKGNGKVGLEQRMALTEEREEKRDRREWALTTIILAEAIALVISVIVV